jgi:hypothetical protein
MEFEATHRICPEFTVLASCNVEVLRLQTVRDALVKIYDLASLHLPLNKSWFTVAVAIVVAHWARFEGVAIAPIRPSAWMAKRIPHKQEARTMVVRSHRNEGPKDSRLRGLGAF